MTYVPTEWQTGDIVTAEKLNKLENGVAGGGGGVLVVHDEYDGESGTVTLDKTWKEIHDALASGQIVVLVYTTQGGYVQQDIFKEAEFYESSPGKPYQLNTFSGAFYSAETENDHPDNSEA